MEKAGAYLVDDEDVEDEHGCCYYFVDDAVKIDVAAGGDVSVHRDALKEEVTAGAANAAAAVGVVDAVVEDDVAPFV